MSRWMNGIAVSAMLVIGSAAAMAQTNTISVEAKGSDSEIIKKGAPLPAAVESRAALPSLDQRVRLAQNEPSDSSVLKKRRKAPDAGPTMSQGQGGASENGQLKKRKKPSQMGGQGAAGQGQYAQEQKMKKKKSQSAENEMKGTKGYYKGHARYKYKHGPYIYFYSGYYYDTPWWSGPAVYGNDGSGISCPEGRSLLRNRGFYRVQAIDCYGSRFTYRAMRHGDPVRVSLSAYSGRIISVRPL